MGFYIDQFDGKYITRKTTATEKKVGYKIVCVNNPSERNFVIVRDALSHMENASIYRVVAKAQLRMNNNFGHNMDALVTGRSGTNVSTPLFSVLVSLRML